MIAALLLTALQTPVAPPAQVDIDAAIDRGAAFLERGYAKEVAQGGLAGRERLGQSALSLYTLLQSGVDPKSDTLRRLTSEIASQRVERTYDAACLALALHALDPIDHFRWLEEIAQRLMSWQTDDGDWAYPEGGNDLSNTQFAALGLWAAARSGVDVPADVWQRLALGTLSYQAGDGGFGYAPDGSSSTGSMTAAGIGTLAISEARLRLADALSLELATRIERARAAGMAWLAANFSVATNPRSGGWHYYYLYGLERVGAFHGAGRIGAHDWYGEGAALLVAAQQEDGAWMGGHDRADTCFALLFLRRATASDTRGRARKTGEQASPSDDAAVRIAVEGSGPVGVRVEGWNPRAVRELEWPGERGLGPRVARVEWRVDGELASLALGDRAQAAGGVRFADSLVLHATGARRIQARAIVIAPDGVERTLESREVETAVTRALPGWVREDRPRSIDDLVPALKAKASASSRAKGKKAPLGLDHAPELAIDGNARTAWIADAEDAERELSISFVKPRECGSIQVSAAVLPGLDLAGLGRPVEVEIEVNGRNARRIAFDPDPRRPMQMDLDPPITIRRLDLRIRASAPGALGAWVGIGEVELFAPAR